MKKQHHLSYIVLSYKMTATVVVLAVLALATLVSFDTKRTIPISVASPKTWCKYQ